MGVTISNGSLVFPAAIDFSTNEKMVADFEKYLLGVVNELNGALSGTGRKAEATFNPASIQKFGSAAEAAVSSLGRAVELLQKSFGADKLAQLDDQLQKTTDHAEQFSIILDFIQQNAADLNIVDPADAAQLQQNIDAIRQGLFGSVGAAQEFDTAFESASATAGTLFGQIQNLERQVIELEDAMSKTTDKTILDKLSAQTRDMNAQLDAMKARFQALTREGFGDVGSAPGSINVDSASKKDLKAHLQDLTSYATKLGQALSMADNEKEIQKYNTALTDTRGRIDAVNARLEEMDNKVVKATTRLEIVRNLLANMKPDDVGYQELLDEAIQLENRIRNVNRTVGLLGSNEAGIQALKQGLSGLVGGFGAVASAAALFSGEEEKMQQTMTKLFLVIQTVAGAEQFLNTINRESAVVQYALTLARKAGFIATAEQTVAATSLTVAEGAQAVATEGAAAAQWSLNAAMAANPIGAILIAVTAVVAAIALFASNTESAAEAQTKLNEAMAKANRLLADLVELQGQVYADRTERAQDAVAMAQAQGKSAREIAELQQKANQAAKLEAITKLEALGYDKQRIGYEKAKLESVVQQMHSLRQLEVANKELTDEQAEQLKLLESQESLIKSTLDAAIKYFDVIEGANTKREVLTAEEATAARERAIISATAAAEARVIVARKGTEEELKAQLTAIEARRRKELSDVNITAGERVKVNAEADKEIEAAKRQSRKRQYEDEISLVKATLATAKVGSLEEFNAKMSLIALEAKGREDEEDISSARIIEIRAEEAKAIADLNRKYTQETNEIDLQRAISGINERLIAVRDGSAEEVELKRDLITRQEQMELVKARGTILNEQQLAIRIKEIHTKSIADRKKLDEDYASKTLKKWLDEMRRSTQLQNQELQRVVDNPFSAPLERLNAQQKILQNNKRLYTESIALIRRMGATGAITFDDMNKLLLEFDGRLADVNAQLEVTSAEKFLTIIDQIAGTMSTASGALRTFSGDLRGVNDGLADTLETLSDMIDGFGGIVQLAGAIGGSFQNGKFNAQGAAGGANGIGGSAGIGASLGTVVAAAAVKLGVIGSAVGPWGTIIGAAVGAVAGVVIAAVKGGKKVRESLQKTYEAQYAFLLNQELGEFRINELLRQRNILKAQEVDLTLAGLKAQKQAVLENQRANALEQERILRMLHGESFITGVNAQKYGGFLGLWRKKRPVNEYASLLGMTADEIEKLYTSGQLDGRAKELFEQLKRLQAEGENLNQMLGDLERQAQEVFTGTTAESITDSIVEGFRNGQFAAESFADNFEDLMRNAALNALKYQYLEGPLKDFYEQFAKAAESDGVLTESEIAKLQDLYNSIIKQAGDQFKYLEDITGLPLADGDGGGNSLKGAIKGMTEQQAELLAGQFGGLRLTSMQQLAVMNQQLAAVNRIQVNTEQLYLIQKSIRNLEINGIKLVK